MADIFLSYANEDRETARAVAGLLESAGCTVWWDRRIPAGRTWRSMIEEALREMRCMVVLWSSHSVESDWVKEEAEEARALGRLIPVLIEPVKPPVGFRSIQAADLINWDGSKDALGARQLIADLESLMAKTPRKLSDEEKAPAEKQPIPDSSVEDASAVDGSAAKEQPYRLSRRPPVRGSDSASRNLPARWKTATVGAVVVIAVLGSFLWFGKKDRRTPAPVPEVAAVKPPPLPAPTPTLVTLGLRADRQEIAGNETLNLTVKGQYSDGTQKNILEGVRWLSSEPRVATVDEQGRITGRQPGETKITVQYGAMVSPAWILTVRAEKAVAAQAVKPATETPAVAKLVALTVFATRREVKTQERLPLRVKARYSDGKERGLSSGVEWRSSDASIASVDSRGELVALRAGKIAVVARSGGIESVALDIVVRESVIKPVPEPPPYKSAAESPQATPAKAPVQTISIVSYINQAKSYRVQGNYAAALGELEKARAISPASQEVLDEIEATRRACNAERRLGRADLNC